ncbi:transposase [Thermococcus litoralis DSM 5473]|uniref:Transposase n=1 Tax=Thermococcus litoralis (strain ATCC 51850 / DSM 5473 / JCM 8560 / NS-C) TaxID=523849 RepID=H3ZND5_THELN|nr:RNA-guided endonuclease TnpB family protein [Thermococcus litoralis]EHR78559.1 transposase [Thermococcus litoralis DSM 5473]
MRSYRFRIYPSKAQQERMLQHMELCRWLYNELLRAIRENPSLRRTDTQRLIVELKKEKPELKEVYSKVLQMVNHQLWNNLTVLKVLKKNGHKIGKLRYKTSPNSWKTLNYNQSGFKLDEGRKRLHLSKIGEVPIKLHRKIKGRIKGVIIKRTKSGKWYAIFQVEEEPEPLPKTGRAVGIDLGVANFVVDSDGNAFENPLFLEKSLERIKKIQRRLSRKQKGSKNWEKERIKLAKAYEKLTNQRNDFLHKLALYYVRNYDIIVVESLKPKNMVENGHRSLNRRLLDSSLGAFIRILSDKAERAGRRVVFVEPAYTSRTCSRCGFVVEELPLSERVFRCPKCGLVMDRDLNASFNILRRGLDEGLGRPGLPVEGRPLPRVVPFEAVITGQVFLMKQEAPPERPG